MPNFLKGSRPSRTNFCDPKFFGPKDFLDSKNFLDPKDLWREKTELLNLRLSKLARAKILL